MDLQLRQQRILLRSAQLRSDLAHQSEVLKAPLAHIDRMQRGVLWLYRHPLAMAALAAATVALKPRNAMSKIGRAWTLWTMVNRFLR